MNEPCCSEYRCTRKKPILIRRGPLSGRWYCITAYKSVERNGNQFIAATTKHDVTDDLTRALVEAGWIPPKEDA